MDKLDKLSGHKKFFYSSKLAICNVLIVSFLRQYVFLSLALLSLCSYLMIKIDGNKKASHLFFAGFIFGPLSEAFCIHFGAWQYSNPFIIGIPMYLPFVWGGCALFIKRLVYRFD
jgi:uncharacterized membrane protein YoaT (DUF817 family)